MLFQAISPMLARIDLKASVAHEDCGPDIMVKNYCFETVHWWCTDDGHGDYTITAPTFAHTPALLAWRSATMRSIVVPTLTQAVSFPW